MEISCRFLKNWNIRTPMHGTDSFWIQSIMSLQEENFASRSWWLKKNLCLEMCPSFKRESSQGQQQLFKVSKLQDFTARLLFFFFHSWRSTQVECCGLNFLLEKLCLLSGENMKIKINQKCWQILKFSEYQVSYATNVFEL